MSGYIAYIQKLYPSLKYYKLAVLKSLDGACSQYEGCNYRLHLDYDDLVNTCPPEQRPMSIMVAMDEFEFLYLKNRMDCRKDVIKQRIYPNQMVAFTNYCLHAGGCNDSGKVCYRLFVCMVSNPDDIPQGKVRHYTW